MNLLVKYDRDETVGGGDVNGCVKEVSLRYKSSKTCVWRLLGIHSLDDAIFYTPSATALSAASTAFSISCFVSSAVKMLFPFTDARRPS